MPGRTRIIQYLRSKLNYKCNFSGFNHFVNAQFRLSVSIQIFVNLFYLTKCFVSLRFPKTSVRFSRIQLIWNYRVMSIKTVDSYISRLLGQDCFLASFEVRPPTLSYYLLILTRDTLMIRNYLHQSFRNRLPRSFLKLGRHISLLPLPYTLVCMSKLFSRKITTLMTSCPRYSMFQTVHSFKTTFIRLFLTRLSKLLIT